MTTGEEILSEGEARGGGHANHNQGTSTCSGAPFEAPASSFFEEGELPPGVAPDDTVRAQFEAQAVIRR